MMYVALTICARIFYGSTLWFVRIKNSLKTQKYQNHLYDILGCLFNQFLHELNDIELFLQHTRLKNQKTCWKYCKITVFFQKRQFLGKNTDIPHSQTSQLQPVAAGIEAIASYTLPISKKISLNLWKVVELFVCLL